MTSESALVLARSLIAEADRKVDSIEKSIFHLTSKSNKYESAAELFMKAAKQYQAAKAHIDAGNAYIRACDCYSRSNNNYNSHNMATCYVQAAQNFSKQDVTAGIAAMLKGISIMTEEGKFDRAAKHEKEIAELFETIGDYDNAIKHYEIAGDYYETEGSKTTGAGCLEKIVPLVAEKGDFHRAVELIEKICDS
jgi:alpha-soluble NSF attachment protein